MEMEKLPDFLLTKLNKDYSQEEVIRILEGYKTKRILSFRVNTIKTTAEEIEQELIKNEIKYERVKWSKDAFIVLNKKENEIQEMDIYKNGKIYLQSLSSMLPPIVLNPMPKNDILDMAAAPGGKTTQIAALSNNEANITACEINKIRAERLRYNLDKQGASSVFVMLEDARNIDNFFSFDQILLDSPCSGSGTININENNLNEYFTTELVERSKKLQIALIKKAIKILKSGKEMVYSTCSILQEENEENIQKYIKKGLVEIVPINLMQYEEIPKLPTKIEGTMCICPDELYEGFFVAKLRKKEK